MNDNRTVVEIDAQLRGNVCAPTNTTHRCDGVCRNGACQPPTCSDGIQNQGETNLDSGGPCAPLGSVRVKGTLRYEEDAAGPGGSPFKPIRYVPVSLVYSGADANLEDDSLNDGYHTVTNGLGYFDFVVPRSVGTNYALKFKPRNWAAQIEKDYYGCDEYVWFLTTTPLSIPSTGEADFGNITVPIRGTPTSSTATNQYARGYWYEWRFWPFCGTDAAQIDGGSAYFNLAEDISVARAWADNHRAPPPEHDTITRADVQYPDSVTTSMYNSVWNEIDINGNTMERQADGSLHGVDPGLYDETVVHEFAHHLEDDIAQIYIWGGSHGICTVRDPGFAMSEGFAEWYSAFIVNKYRNDPAYWMSQRWEDYGMYETPNCTSSLDVQLTNIPTWLTAAAEEIAPTHDRLIQIRRSMGVSRMQDMELGVDALLWDIVDVPGPAYPDSRSDETWDTIGSEQNADKIFKIFDKEFNNFILHPPTICQFVWGDDGWNRQFAGHPETNIDPILTHYNITNNC